MEQALNSGDVHELLKVWEDFNRGEASPGISSTDGDQAREAAAHFLSEVSEVAALEALRANAKAVELLTARRWYVMKSAREGGATWAQIGEVLGITRQAAHDFYRRKIEEQEKYSPDPHDTAAARAVLEE
ncbi:hypothetical protein [Arthrobacter sp. C152]